VEQAIGGSKKKSSIFHLRPENFSAPCRSSSAKQIYMAEVNDHSDTEELGGLFPEPEGYYKPHPATTAVSFTRNNATNPYAISIPSHS